MENLMKEKGMNWNDETKVHSPDPTASWGSGARKTKQGLLICNLNSFSQEAKLFNLYSEFA